MLVRIVTFCTLLLTCESILANQFLVQTNMDGRVSSVLVQFRGETGTVRSAKATAKDARSLSLRESQYLRGQIEAVFKLKSKDAKACVRRNVTIWDQQLGVATTSCLSSGSPGREVALDLVNSLAIATKSRSQIGWIDRIK